MTRVENFWKKTWRGGNEVHKLKHDLAILCFIQPAREAESARAVTGRLCPHSGKGEDFLTGQQFFFTETAVTPERKVEKLFPMSEINRHAEG